MKKALMLMLSAALCFTACFDHNTESASQDAELTGSAVDVSAFPSKLTKIFVLNEGGMGSNNSSLDFLRLKDGNYVTGAFKKMNPEVGGGLGDVGNDIVINGKEAWIVVNNSGIVEVISVKDETEIAAIEVPTPRNIAFDGEYAYVTSWAGAYVTYGSDYSVTDSSNPKGMVYRINLKTKKVAGSVEVGYQPEGIACHDGKLYVANSGGISSQLPPTYSYDNTVSVIDTKSFKVTKTVELAANLKNVMSDGKGNIYVSLLGDYFSVHSGLYCIDTKNSDAVSKVSDYVSVCAIKDDTVWCIGTEDEWDWSGAAKTWKTWSYKNGVKTGHKLSLTSGTPYSLAVISSDIVLVGDAGDYFNPGTVSCYNKGSEIWKVPAGVCPGHFALY